jgi:NADH:ubiquinone oxidoreductase subunit 3 (subunit A)
MLYNYLAILFFAMLGLLVPLMFLLFAKLIGRQSPGNPVKNASYESAEESSGGSRDVDNEYLPYFMLFLPFELTLAMLILWSTVSRVIDYNTSLDIILLVVISMAFSFAGYKLIGDVTGRAKTLYG